MTNGQPSPYQCINCSRLGYCSETSAEKVTAGYYCSRWQEAQPEVYAARYQIVQLFGISGLKAVIAKDLKEDD